MAELRLEGVGKSFGAVAAVSALDLDVRSGELIVLLGPSGAGKTTTLRLVAGLERPDRGRVHIDGRDVTGLPPAARDVTFVFQQYSLYPHLNVYDNLAFPLRSPLRRTSEAEVRARVHEIAAMLRLEDKLDSPATRLSGDQMQRVAIGRALVRRPALYLMDEPLSSLDARLRNDLRLELKRIQQDFGATMLYVTHDQIEALTLASRIGVLEAGHLVQLGTPRQIYEDPDSSSVASRLGSPRINLLPRAAFPEWPLPGSVVSIGVRAEHLALCHSALAPAASEASLAAQVTRIEQLSDQHLVHLRLAAGDHPVVAASARGQLFAPGDAVRLTLLESLWFDAEGRRVRR